MKNHLSFNLLFGLAAASFFAVSAFAQEAAPAAEAPAAAPVAEAPAAAPAETQAAPAQEAPAAAPAQETPAEQPVAAAPAEEEKSAESAPAENTNPGEVADAAGNAFDMLKASMSEGTSEAKMEVKYNGEVEFDIYTGNVLEDEDLNHSYASTFDLNFEVKFNEKWSASVQLEADGETTDPTAIYNGAFIQYTHNEKLSVKVGDLTFSEGAFLNYYGYDDPADNAAGMAEHDIRGVEIDYNGFILGLGYGRGDNDNQVCVEEDGEETCVGVAYDAHLAYELGLGEHTLRPFVDYKSYQEAKHNELHAGLDANLKFGAFGLHAVYGLHADYLGEDSPKATHAFLAEPSLAVGSVNVKGSVFYAYFDEDEPTVHGEEIPEYFFAYAEPSVSVFEALFLGIPLEYHTNTLNKNDDISTFDVGVRAYFTPVEGLEFTGFAMFDIPVGDDAGDDTGLKLGLESVFSF